jgi:ATP/maltotriose-dependent transcriptional regulator MalT
VVVTTCDMTADEEFPVLPAFQHAIDRIVDESRLAELRARKEQAIREAAEEALRVKARAECPLSDRELQVVQALAEGGGYKAAAERLDISWRTVKTHMKRIYEALGIDGKVAVPSALTVMICLRSGWIP